MIKNFAFIEEPERSTIRIDTRAKWCLDEKGINGLVRSFHAKHFAYLAELELARNISNESGCQTVLIVNAHILYLRFMRDYLIAAGRLVSKGTHRVRFDAPNDLSHDWLNINGLALPKNLYNLPRYELTKLILSPIHLIMVGYRVNIDLTHDIDQPLRVKLDIKGRQRWIGSNRKGETNGDAVSLVLAGLLKVTAAFSIRLEDYLREAGIPEVPAYGLGPAN